MIGEIVQVPCRVDAVGDVSGLNRVRTGVGPGLTDVELVVGVRVAADESRPCTPGPRQERIGDRDAGQILIAGVRHSDGVGDDVAGGANEGDISGLGDGEVRVAHGTGVLELEEVAAEIDGLAKDGRPIYGVRAGDVDTAVGGVDVSDVEVLRVRGSAAGGGDRRRVRRRGEQQQVVDEWEEGVVRPAHADLAGGDDRDPLGWGHSDAARAEGDVTVDVVQTTGIGL